MHEHAICIVKNAIGLVQYYSLVNAGYFSVDLLSIHVVILR